MAVDDSTPLTGLSDSRKKFFTSSSSSDFENRKKNFRFEE